MSTKYQQNEQLLRLAEVSETGLITLFCRAHESRSARPQLVDKKAEQVAGQIAPLLIESDSKLLRSLGQGKLRKSLAVMMSARARQYDAYARGFLSRYPHGVVVNLGCGLDSRFERLDDGRLELFDLDLPQMIDFKRQFFTENERYHLIGASVFDEGWRAQIAALQRPVLFLAEGLFMYLEEEKVKTLVTALNREFPGAELVCEVFNKKWLQKTRGGIVKYKMQKQLNVGSSAGFTFGVWDGHEMESWDAGIQLLDEWTYFDADLSKVSLMRWMGKIEAFRKIQWTLHYLLAGKA